MTTDTQQRFEDRFIYDEAEDVEFKYLGVRDKNRPASDTDILTFIEEEKKLAKDEQRRKMAEKIRSLKQDNSENSYFEDMKEGRARDMTEKHYEIVEAHNQALESAATVIEKGV